MPATKVPQFDPDTKGALDRDFPDRRDEQMQASVLATFTPLTNFWPNIAKQSFTGNDQWLTPLSEIIKVTKNTLTLIGNASNYTTI